INEARRYRKMAGGAMRQAGFLAAAGLYALENHVERLHEDHDNARLLAEELAELNGLWVDLDKVQSNMVFANVTADGLNAVEYGGRLKERGVLVNAMSGEYFRAVTHLGIEREDILAAVEVFAESLE
ncbi:MAG: beta-eliminating lyase-related protein, partial [bacterium]